jgi:hypothetical protein
MIHTTLLPALLAMGAPEPLALSTYATLEPSVLLAPRADDEDVFSYSYIEVGFASYDPEQFDDQADTYFGEVSIELFKILNIFLGYENLSYDFDNLESDLWTLGAGLHFSVLPKLDLTGDLAWLANSLDGDNIDEDSDEFQLRVGARWMLMYRESFGLEAFGRAVGVTRDEDIYDDDNAVGFDLGLRVHFLERFSVAGEYSELEDDVQVAFSARFSF